MTEMTWDPPHPGGSLPSTGALACLYPPIPCRRCTCENPRRRGRWCRTRLMALSTSSSGLRRPPRRRNFVQLCLEGYYDDTIFHRIIKDFLVQGGDPTGTGTGSGGESIYGGAFVDEYHSRLRFKNRGLVACANEGRSHSNGSQFFITLDRCDWLDKKHTIFGKNDRPLNPPPKIISVEVLWNPFDDIVPRTQESPRRQSTSEHEKKDSHKKFCEKTEPTFIWRGSRRG